MAQYVQMTMQDDLANRSLAINWPEGFAPGVADLFSHNSCLINASCETVWKHIVDVAHWPEWYPNARNVELLDNVEVLGAGVRWRWTTFGIDIESRVHECVPGSRLGWFGYAPGEAPAFYHTWLLLPDPAGCQAVTDEVGIGPAAAQLRKDDESLMHRGHDLWLAGLKWVSEGR